MHNGAVEVNGNEVGNDDGSNKEVEGKENTEDVWGEGSSDLAASLSHYQ